MSHARKYLSKLGNSMLTCSYYGFGGGGIVGGIAGYYESRKYKGSYYKVISSEDRIREFANNFGYILYGMWIGSFSGFILGGLWPISVPTLILSTFDLEVGKNSP